MVVKSKKICLLLAGGTILSEKDLTCVEKESDIADWLVNMPELSIMADIEPVFIFGEKEVKQGVEFWQKIITEIYNRLDSCDGFIITNKINDILYNSIATSFAIENINKPIIFTGSQLPILEKSLVELKKKNFGGLGVKANLINAVQIATMEMPAVGLMFGNRCIRAVKAQCSAVYSLNIFTSVDDTYLAKIDFGVSPSEKVQLPTQKSVLKNNFEPKVFVIKYYPGMSFNLLKDSIGDNKGLIIESMTIEPFSPEFLDDLKSLKIPVVVYNKFFVQKMRVQNIIEISNMTLEATLVKFMWTLSQAEDIFEIRELMTEEFCNEFIHE